MSFQFIFASSLFVDLLDFHNNNEGNATMCVREYEFKVPYGSVNIEGCKVTEIKEKPIHKSFVNAGIYVMNPDFIQEINGIDFLDMPNYINNKILSCSKVSSYPIHEHWADIGRMDDYEKANIESKDLTNAIK